MLGCFGVVLWLSCGFDNNLSVSQQERTTFHIEANVEDRQLYRIYQTYKDFTGKDCIGFYRTLQDCLGLYIYLHQHSSTFINLHKPSNDGAFAGESLASP